MYMRTKNLFIALTMTTAMAAMSACSNDENETQVVDITKPIELMPTLTASSTTDTRVTSVKGGQSATWESGDVVGLQVKAGTYTDFVTRTYSGNGFGAATKSLYWQNTKDSHTFIAYYPATGSPTSLPATIRVSLPDGNSGTIAYATHDALKAVTYMQGTKNSIATNSKIDIALTHCMSQITVSMTADESHGGNPADIDNIDNVQIEKASGSFYTTATFTPGTGSISAPAANATKPATQVTTFKDGGIHYAILIPGEPLPADTKFVITMKDGTTYTYKVTAENAIDSASANTSYDFGLKLQKGIVTLGSFTVKAWTSIDKEGNAGMDIKNQ